ncbi:MAG: hypothetical protein WD989_00140 [Candidatus Paceibacterota bacterium]
MSYRFLKYFFAIILLVYFVGGLASRNSAKGELYPFFSWFLFDQVPNEKQNFTMRIISHGGQRHEPPLEFSQATDIFRTINQSATQYFYVIQDLGYGILNGNDRQIENARERLEKIFLGMPATYEILQVRYDPVQYWRTKEFKELKIIGVYESGK